MQGFKSRPWRVKIYTVGAAHEDFPIKAMDIARATLKDPLLSKVYQYTLNGWPEICDDVELKPFHRDTVPDRSNLTGNALPERLGNAKGTLRERKRNA